MNIRLVSRHRPLTVVISGITSALGISLAQLLAKKGIQVTGFARRIEKVRGILTDPLITLRTADLNDTILMRELCADADGVVHLAALSSPWGKRADFIHANVKGTQSIANASCNRFIYVSTPSIYFDGRDRIDIREEDPLPIHSINDYAATKRMAEEIVADRAIILRPRAIFGPHDQTLFPRIIKACQQKGIPRFTKRSPMVDITYVDNVAHAISLALEAPASCVGQKYNITNGEPLPLWEILERLLRPLQNSRPLQNGPFKACRDRIFSPTLSGMVEKMRCGQQSCPSQPAPKWPILQGPGVLQRPLLISPKIRQIPYPLAYTAAWLSELKSRITGMEPTLTRYGVGVMTYSQTLSIEKAKCELGYQPIISITEGIKRYVDWLQAQ